MTIPVLQILYGAAPLTCRGFKNISLSMYVELLNIIPRFLLAIFTFFVCVHESEVSRQ